MDPARGDRKPSRATQRNAPRALPDHLQQAADDWLSAAATGVIGRRSGDVYRPSALRAYKQALNPEERESASSSGPPGPS